MRRWAYSVLASATLSLAACSIKLSTEPDSLPSAGAGNSSAGDSSASAGAGDSSASGSGVGGGSAGGGSAGGGSAGLSGSGGTGSGGASSGGGSAGSGLVTPPGSTPSPMPVISHGVPAFASNSDSGSPPSNANDVMPDTSWASTKLPAWLAYDLSAVPVAQRQEVLIAWYDASPADYINSPPSADMNLAIDYSLEINTAAGGGSAPTSGWTTVASITGNNRSTRQRLVALEGANWVRMNVTKSSNSRVVQLNLDVHSAPDGASDSWLFMGDSITFMTSTYLFSDIPRLVNQASANRWPALVPAGIGGTNTTTALEVIQDTMSDFPGRFVTLNYGTNDNATEYHMEELVKAVLAAGKVPVVPHMPWSALADIQAKAPVINKMIDDLYVKYPMIVRGPDFWTILKGRTDLIPANDVHPTDAGAEEFRKQWAVAMTK